MRDFSKFDQQKLQRELEKEQQGEEATVRLPTPEFTIGDLSY